MLHLILITRRLCRFSANYTFAFVICLEKSEYPAGFPVVAESWLLQRQVRTKATYLSQNLIPLLSFYHQHNPTSHRHLSFVQTFATANHADPGPSRQWDAHADSFVLSAYRSGQSGNEIWIALRNRGYNIAREEVVINLVRQGVRVATDHVDVGPSRRWDVQADSFALSAYRSGQLGDEIWIALRNQLFEVADS